METEVPGPELTLLAEAAGPTADADIPRPLEGRAACEASCEELKPDASDAGPAPIVEDADDPVNGEIEPNDAEDVGTLTAY